MFEKKKNCIDFEINQAFQLLEELLLRYSFPLSLVFLFFTNTTKNIVANANNPPPKKKDKPRSTLSNAVPINGATTLIKEANP